MSTHLKAEAERIKIQIEEFEFNLKNAYATATFTDNNPSREYRCVLGSARVKAKEALDLITEAHDLLTGS